MARTAKPGEEPKESWQKRQSRRQTRRHGLEVAQPGATKGHEGAEVGRHSTPGVGVRAEAERAMEHHVKSGNPLDTVQIMDPDTGDYLAIDEVCKLYATEKKKPGRPGIYDPEFHPRAAFLLCADHGAQQDQIARHFGISYNTIIAWMWRYPLFADAIRNGWSIHMVKSSEKALVQRAVGYEYEESKRQRVPIYETVFDDKGKPHQIVRGYETVVTETVTKKMPPDTTALMFLLQNRDGHRWKNVRKVEQTHKVEHALPGAQAAKTSTTAILELDTDTLSKVANAVKVLEAQADEDAEGGDE